ncbi:MAG: hypothetical protein A2033_00995 [Bacteroidetes bacterium GWA2_31_9]|nr:MAG: hypothetical protein A2033_00995 [Bacteroidetes bacterium GWA2_31_9]
MNNKYFKFLFDINKSIDNINNYIGDSKIFEQYDLNPLLQDAVERNLEIIGEAMKNLLEIKPDISISFARKIVNTRNKISHGYDEIENSEIWNIIINYLPKLKTEVEALLNKN